MSGNVWEWTLTQFADAENTSLSGGGTRVLHGASFYRKEDEAKCAYRREFDPYERNEWFGFRLCRSVYDEISLYVSEYFSHSENSNNKIDTGKKIYIGNLPYNLNEEQLHTLFSKFGKPISVKLITDKFRPQSRRSKGFGIVEMSINEADEAIKGFASLLLNDDRMVLVQEARVPKQRQ